MTRIPIDATVPIACTANSTEISARIETVERMRSHLRSIERTERGILLGFPADPAVEEEIQQFTADEKQCCQFWGFEIEGVAGELTLLWEGPPAVGAFFDELVTVLRSDEPLTAFGGLL